MPPADALDLPSLLDRYERPLVRYASSLLGDLDGAKDVVQETFIRLVRLTATGGGPCAPGVPAEGDTPPEEAGARRLEAWLFTVCRNCAIDQQRKNSRIIPMPTLDHDRADEQPTPAAQMEQRESAALIFRLLEKLSTNQREVIRLKFQNDLSYKEIAEITQLTVTNVGFLMHTGLKKLRALLGESPGELCPLPATASKA